MTHPSIYPSIHLSIHLSICLTPPPPSWDGDDEDLIEVYDENGELVGRYTEAEFERLERSKP